MEEKKDDSEERKFGVVSRMQGSSQRRTSLPRNSPDFVPNRGGVIKGDGLAARRTSYYPLAAETSRHTHSRETGAIILIQASARRKLAYRRTKAIHKAHAILRGFLVRHRLAEERKRLEALHVHAFWRRLQMGIGVTYYPPYHTLPREYLLWLHPATLRIYLSREKVAVPTFEIKGLYIADLEEVRTGVSTYTFVHTADRLIPPPYEDQCLSLVGAEAVYDLELGSQLLREEVLLGLQLLMDATQPNKDMKTREWSRSYKQKARLRVERTLVDESLVERVMQELLAGMVVRKRINGERSGKRVLLLQHDDLRFRLCLVKPGRIWWARKFGSSRARLKGVDVVDICAVRPGLLPQLSLTANPDNDSELVWLGRKSLVVIASERSFCIELRSMLARDRLLSCLRTLRDPTLIRTKTDNTQVPANLVVQLEEYHTTTATSTA